ncbi:MAG TPA: hypothetical protein VKH37_10830, partial [Ferruginibacter sp.]|nr:hypothetical protein [Ferruginibacter sp.]
MNTRSQEPLPVIIDQSPPRQQSPFEQPDLFGDDTLVDNHFGDSIANPSTSTPKQHTPSSTHTCGLSNPEFQRQITLSQYLSFPIPGSSQVVDTQTAEPPDIKSEDSVESDFGPAPSDSPPASPLAPAPFVLNHNMADDGEHSDRSNGGNGRHRRSNQPIVPHAYSSFNPGQFSGNGSRDAVDYLNHYERIASALNFTPAQYRDVFSLNLTGTASYWFTDICDIANAHDPPIPITWDYIKSSFMSIFAMAGQSKDQALEHQLANRKLQLNEPPLVYVYDMLAL